MELLANLGGIYAGIMVVFKVLAKFINEKVIKAKFIRSLFYVRKPNSMVPKFKVNLGESYLHNKLQSFTIIKVRFYNCFRSKANSDQINEIN